MALVITRNEKWKVVKNSLHPQFITVQVWSVRADQDLGPRSAWLIYRFTLACWIFCTFSYSVFPIPCTVVFNNDKNTILMN